MPNEAYVETYRNAMAEFEKLTNSRTATLKNKGKEEGLKKLSVLFKSGKSLDQRTTDWDAAMAAFDTAKTDEAYFKALKNAEVVLDKLRQGLKLNIAQFTEQSKSLGPVDAQLKTGFDVLINRLNQIGNRAKVDLEQKRQIVSQKKGTLGPNEKVKAELKRVYLTIKKGCDETEAIMKVFIAQPTDKHLEDAFTPSGGPRTIGTAVTQWKMCLKQQPSLRDKLPADPEHLLKNINDLSQRRPVDFWKAKFKADQPGWQDRAKAEAKKCLQQVELWRRMADEVKKISG